MGVGEKEEEGGREAGGRAEKEGGFIPGLNFAPHLPLKTLLPPARGPKPNRI